jgi:hypothetical protein
MSYPAVLNLFHFYACNQYSSTDQIAWSEGLAVVAVASVPSSGIWPTAVLHFLGRRVSRTRKSKQEHRGSSIFMDLALHSLIEIYRISGGVFCLLSVYFFLVCLLSASLDPDKGGIIFLRKVCKVLSYYTYYMLLLVFLRCRILWRRSRCQETVSEDCNRLTTLVCVCQWSVKCSSEWWIQVVNNSSIQSIPRL